MPLPILLDDALRVTADGSELRLSLPWIRSLPLASLQDVEVTIDGVAVESSPRLADAWWYIQDRVVVTGPALDAGTHEVMVSFDLEIPYLAAGPDGPLRLPFRERRTLAPSEPAAGVRGDAA